jgi:ribosome-associated protein
MKIQLFYNKIRHFSRIDEFSGTLRVFDSGYPKGVHFRIPSGYQKIPIFEKNRFCIMLDNILNDRDLSQEFTITASRSSGPGGQHVNKVSTKVELRFNVIESELLTSEEKEIILTKLAKKINSLGELVLVAQTYRSQLKNKEKAVEKLYTLLSKALIPVRKRKPTKPSRAAREKRLEEKRIRSEKKERRKSPQ